MTHRDTEVKCTLCKAAGPAVVFIVSSRLVPACRRCRSAWCDKPHLSLEDGMGEYVVQEIHKS